LDKRYKDVRQLFDFATNLADEILENHPTYSANEVFQLACEIAAHNFYEPSGSPIGEVDRKKVAFVLQDGESVVGVGHEGEPTEEEGNEIIWELHEEEN
jgi:hypothetical protein